MRALTKKHARTFAQHVCCCSLRLRMGNSVVNPRPGRRSNGESRVVMCGTHANANASHSSGEIIGILKSFDRHFAILSYTCHHQTYKCIFFEITNIKTCYMLYTPCTRAASNDNAERCATEHARVCPGSGFLLLPWPKITTCALTECECTTCEQNGVHASKHTRARKGDTV